MSLASLYTPVEQAGFLRKQSSSKKWEDRYFILKGGFLFYWKDRKGLQSAKKLHGVIPLESAKIETELPPGATDAKAAGHVITITLHSSHAFTSRHNFYVLAAPSQEVQMAWVNALWQAAIPRADLIQHLASAGKLADVLATYASGVQANFPVADATVLSTGGRARTAALANVGSLAGMIRRHKGTPAVSDLNSLPVVVPDRPGLPANVLARTTSGNLVTAPSSSVVKSDASVSESRPGTAQAAASAAPAAAASSAPAPVRVPTPAPADAGMGSPAAGKAAAQGQLAVSAAAGPGAAAVVAAGKPAGASKEKTAAVETAKVPAV